MMSQSLLRFQHISSTPPCSMPKPGATGVIARLSVIRRWHFREGRFVREMARRIKLYLAPNAVQLDDGRLGVAWRNAHHICGRRVLRNTPSPFSSPAFMYSIVIVPLANATVEREPGIALSPGGIIRNSSPAQ